MSLDTQVPSSSFILSPSPCLCLAASLSLERFELIATVGVSSACGGIARAVPHVLLGVALIALSFSHSRPRLPL